MSRPALDCRACGACCGGLDPADRCPHLAGEVGVAVRCTVYDERPAVCRAFEPGSWICLLARASAKLGEHPGPPGRDDLSGGPQVWVDLLTVPCWECGRPHAVEAA